MHQNRLQLKVEEIEAIVLQEIGYILREIDNIGKGEIEQRLEGMYQIILNYQS